LEYLAKPATKYVDFQFEMRIMDYLEFEATDAEKTELVELSKRMQPDNDAIEAWMDQHRLTKHPEAALVYFTRHLIALGADAGLLKLGT